MEVYYLVLNYYTAYTLGMNPVTRLKSMEELSKETEFLQRLGYKENEHFAKYVLSYDGQSKEEDSIQSMQDWDTMISRSKMLRPVNIP